MDTDAIAVKIYRQKILFIAMFMRYLSVSYRVLNSAKKDDVVEKNSAYADDRFLEYMLYYYSTNFQKYSYSGHMKRCKVQNKNRTLTEMPRKEFR